MLKCVILRSWFVQSKRIVDFASENCLLCLLQHSKEETWYWLFSLTFLEYFSYCFIPIWKKKFFIVLEFVFIKSLTCWAVKMIQWFFWILNLIRYGDAEEIPLVPYIVECEYLSYVILYLNKISQNKEMEQENSPLKKPIENVFFPASCRVCVSSVCTAGPDPWQLLLPSAAAEQGSKPKSHHWIRSSFLRAF